MNKFMRILRDPNPSENEVGETPPETTPVVTPSANPPIPKGKEEWDKLAKDDPQRWISLTQARMDQTVRQAREAKEKLEKEQERANNLSVELENIKKSQKPIGEIPVSEIHDPNKPFSKENMPQTKEQWDTLWIEDPNLASDLRNHKFFQDQKIQEQRQQAQSEFAKSWKESAKLLLERHPDMYVQETDETGNVKLDGNGKPVLKINPTTNAPILNLESEKGKIFAQVYSEDEQGFNSSKFGPRLAMSEMERRLQERGNQQVQNANQGVQMGQNETQQPDQRGTLPGGVTPPATGKTSFSSDEEKAHATRAVERGVYKNLEEYCSLRDGKDFGILDENRFPEFTKK